MLKHPLLKYIAAKIRFNRFKIRSVRYPLNAKFKMLVGNILIQGKKSELIAFVQNKYLSKDVDIKALYCTINWSKIYANVSKEERRKFEKRHMDIVLQCDLKYPIIVTSNTDGEIKNILDGNHRIVKAYVLKKKTIKTYVVPENDLLTFKTG